MKGKFDLQIHERINWWSHPLRDFLPFGSVNTVLFSWNPQVKIKESGGFVFTWPLPHGYILLGVIMEKSIRLLTLISPLPLISSFHPQDTKTQKIKFARKGSFILHLPNFLFSLRYSLIMPHHHLASFSMTLRYFLILFRIINDFQKGWSNNLD